MPRAEHALRNPAFRRADGHRSPRGCCLAAAATPGSLVTPGMLRPLEDVLALLTSAGFTGEDALHMYPVLFGYMYGHPQ